MTGRDTFGVTTRELRPPATPPVPEGTRVRIRRDTAERDALRVRPVDTPTTTAGWIVVEPAAITTATDPT